MRQGSTRYRYAPHFLTKRWPPFINLTLPSFCSFSTDAYALAYITPAARLLYCSTALPFSPVSAAVDQSMQGKNLTFFCYVSSALCLAVLPNNRY